VDRGDLPWLTVRSGYAILLTVAAVCIVSFGVHLMLYAPDYDLARLWKHQSGKAYNREMFLSKTIYRFASETKWADHAYAVTKTHPLYLPRDLIETWICEDLGAGVGGEAGVPAWLTEKFKAACRDAFRYWDDEQAMERVGAALNNIPSYLPVVLKSKSMISFSGRRGDGIQGILSKISVKRK
jgi:hypothetical protein